MATRRDLSPGRPASSASRAVTYEAVVARATRRFVAEGSLDIQGLADSLAVSRATLYRVITDQDRLLGDVLWVLTARTLRIAEREAVGTGVDRLMDISRRFHALVQDFPPLRRFTDLEPERAFRVLFTTSGRVHERTVARWSQVTRQAEATGEVQLPFDADQFSEMFVRLGETMLWSDLLGASAVDVALWERVQRSLFTLSLAPDAPR